MSDLISYNNYRFEIRTDPIRSDPNTYCITYAKVEHIACYDIIQCQILKYNDLSNKIKYEQIRSDQVREEKKRPYLPYNKYT